MDDLTRLLRESNPFEQEQLSDREWEVFDDIVAGRRKPRRDVVAPSVRVRRVPLFIAAVSFMVAVSLIAIVVLTFVRPHPALAVTPDPLSAESVAVTTQMLEEELMKPVSSPASTSSRRGAEWEGWFLQFDPDRPAATFVQPQRTQIIWDTDLSGVSRVIAGTPADAAGQAIEPIPDGSDEPGTTLYEVAWGPGELAVPFQATPPDEVDAMRAYLHGFLTAQGITDAVQPTAGDYAMAVFTLLQSWTLSDAAERAAIAVMLRSPGVTVAGTTTDRAGRDGMLLDLEPTHLDPSHRTQLVIDPVEGRLLAVEVTTTDGIPDFAIAPGSVTEYTFWR